MTVADLIAELQKMPQDLPVRISVGSAKDTVLATLGSAKVSLDEDEKGRKEVGIDGWAADTKMFVEWNNCDREDDEEEGDDDE